MLHQSNIIILAAGQGSRLLPLTEHTPKPMLSVNRETLIQRIIRQLLALNAENISVIIGHQKDLLAPHLRSCYKDIKIIENPKYQDDTNIYSAYLGLKEHSDNLIIESDIIFEDRAVKKMLNSESADSSIWFTSGHFKKHHVGGALRSKDGYVEDLRLVQGYAEDLAEYKKTLGVFWLSKAQVSEYKRILFDEYNKNMKQYYMSPWIQHQKWLKSREVDLSPYFSVSFNTAEEYKSTIEALNEIKTS